MISAVVRAQPILGPPKTLDLHTHAEWRVNAKMKFDRAGRLLILYRDKSKLNSNGNWHLLRLTEPLSAKPLREEITFSIPQEPVDDNSAERWNLFYSELLPTPDGSHAYATFNGLVVTAKTGPPVVTGGRNVRIEPFSSVVSLDLGAFRLLASADVAPRPDSNPGQIDAEGNLLLLHSTETDWKIVAMDESLHVVKTVTIPIPPDVRTPCQFRPDFKMECPARGGGDLVLDSRSTVQIPRSECKMSSSLVEGFGKDETLNGGLIQADHLCVLHESGREERVSSDLLPRCHSGWRPAAISPDHRSLLTSCFEEGSFLDTFFYTSKATLQIVDAVTLAQRATIPLPTRPRLAYAIFHSSGTTTVAVLEDVGTLRMYSLSD